MVLKVVDFVKVEKPQVYVIDVRFEKKVRSVMASIKGFELMHTKGFNRQVLRINPSVDVVPDDPFKVYVKLDYKCSDDDKNNMAGNVQILLLAELE